VPFGSHHDAPVNGSWSAARLRLPDSTTIPPTHWRTGALIGGGALGLLGAVTFIGLCGYDGPCHQPVLAAAGGFALGGLVGFGVGALIGGQFPLRTP
jgi:hypothetical protein